MITEEEIGRAQLLLDQAEKDYLDFHQQKEKSFFDWDQKTIFISDINFYCDPIAQKGECSRVGDGIANFLISAKKEMTIVSPYLILTPKMKYALKQALKNGVKVHFYTNSEKSTDNRTTQLAYEYRFKEIAFMGNVDIYEFEGPETLHAKFLFKDHKDCMLMTYNIDWRSEIKNLETALQFENEELTDQLRNWLQAHCNQFTLVASQTRILKKPLEDRNPNDFVTRFMIRSLEKHL